MKIVGIILLSVLALILLLLALVLFAPIRYRVTGGAESSGTSGASFHGLARISWLFGFVRARFDLDGGRYQVKVLIFTLASGSSPGETTRDAEDEPKPAGDTGAVKEPEPERSTETVREPAPTEHEIKPERLLQDEGTPMETTEENGRKAVKKKPSKKRTKKNAEPSSDGGGNFLSILSAVIHFQDKEKILAEILTLLKRILRALKPKQLKLDALVGFEDPSLTGWVLGGAAILQGLTLWDMRVRGNFEKQVFRLKLDVKDTLFPCSLLWPVIPFVLSKPIWRLIKTLLHENG